MLYRKTLALCCCLAAVFSGAAGAKTIYVNNGLAAAADSNPGTASTSPMKTISAGVKVAQPGDTVVVMPGTYTEATTATDISTVGIQIRGKGTAAAPIVIQAQTPGTVTIDQKMNAVGFVVLNASYVTINGFNIQNCYGGGIRMFEGAPSNNMVVENMTVTHCDGVAGDNVGGIYIGGCSNCTITNNTISGVTIAGQYNMNAAGIHGYSQSNCTLSNNVISNAFTGIFHKRSAGTTGLLIQGNIISGVTYGIMYSIGGAGDPPHINQRVYNNIISSSNMAIYAPLGEAASESQGLTIQHNVILGSSGIVTQNYAGVVVQDNIFYNLTGDAEATENGTWKNELTTLSNNLFYSGAAFDLQQYGTGAAHYTTLASFLSATGFSTSTNRQLNPLFTNASASNFTGYTLAASSPGIGAAHDGTNIGAYSTASTKVGLLSSPATGTTGTTAPVVPDPPSNVTVQ
jgi:parallel beta-helix repeat protein